MRRARRGVKAIPGIWAVGGEKHQQPVFIDWYPASARRRPNVRRTTHPDRLLCWVFWAWSTRHSRPRPRRFIPLHEDYHDAR